MLAQAFSSTAARVLAGIAAALAIACLCLWLWGRAGHASAERWEAKSIAERDNHRATKANLAAAQIAAADAARAARLATEEKSRQLAERADHADHDLAAARAAAARFADARRLPVRSGAGAGSATGNAGAASPPDAASYRDGPGADAVVLGQDEFDELVGNTLRLERVRRWGEELIREDLAIPAAEQKED